MEFGELVSIIHVASINVLSTVNEPINYTGTSDKDTYLSQAHSFTQIKTFDGFCAWRG